MTVAEARRAPADAPCGARAMALVAHWQACRRAGCVPTRQDFGPFNLQPWLGSLSIYEALDGGRDFRVRLDGSDVVALTGQDWTGRKLSDIDKEFGTRLCSEIAEVLGHGVPAVQRIPILQKRWQTATRACLPVSSGAGRTADQVFMGLFLDN